MNLIPRKFYLDDVFDDFESTNNMKCDIYEKDGDYHIEMDIPGFDKKDINIEYIYKKSPPVSAPIIRKIFLII